VAVDATKGVNKRSEEWKRCCRAKRSFSDLKVTGAEGLLLDLGSAIHGEVALAFEHQPDQGAGEPGQQAAAAGE